MSRSPIDSRTPAIRAIRDDMVSAPESQVKRIVATIDSMELRGAADELIAPLRPRLNAIRPTRPLRFARLLFMPLDPLVEPAAGWKPEQCTIPRTAIMPMTKIIEAAMGAKADGIKDAIRTRTTDDLDVIASIGESLWPEAGAILASARVSTDWSTTGLNDKVFTMLAAQIGALLRQAAAIDSLVNETAGGLLPPNRQAIETIVRTVSAQAANVLPMLAMLLLTRLPQTIRILQKIESGSTAKSIRAATDHAANVLLSQLDSADDSSSLLAGGSLAQSGLAVTRIASLLREFDQDDPPATRRTMIRAVRLRLSGDCKARFVAGMTTELLNVLRGLTGGAGAVDVIKLEVAARSLRALEQEGRSIGGGPIYGAMMNEAADTVRALPSNVGLALTDRVRLLEIVAGSDAALDVLERSRLLG